MLISYFSTKLYSKILLRNLNTQFDGLTFMKTNRPYMYIVIFEALNHAKFDFIKNAADKQVYRHLIFNYVS